MLCRVQEAQRMLTGLTVVAQGGLAYVVSIFPIRKV